MTTSRHQRRQGRAWSARLALLTLLLQLALPFISLQPLAAAAAAGADAPFVICTGAGLVWINPDGTPPQSDADPVRHCPLCIVKQSAALLPALATLRLPVPAEATLPAALTPVAAEVTTPPLPARGPPGAR